MEETRKRRMIWQNLPSLSSASDTNPDEAEGGGSASSRGAQCGAVGAGAGAAGAAAAGLHSQLSEEYYDDTSIFENKAGLSDDMRFLASMPELCDVTFLVGETREPVCAVKAVLIARSKVFSKLLMTPPPKEHVREKDATLRAASKLKAFIKRSSEPLLNMQPQQRMGPFTSQLSTIQEVIQGQTQHRECPFKDCLPIKPSQDHLHQTLIIEEFEPDVFRQLIEYIHTGCVTLQPRTLLGVMNAADYYGLDELKRACSGFIQCCVNVDTVCALLATAERYIQYKCTKTLVQKVLEFVDDHGNEVLNLGSFALLPQHVVRLILAREELKADEFSKFQAALMWSKKYCDSTHSSLGEVLSGFLCYINFHMIPANVLMKEIHPLGIVPYHVIMNALAYQADPTSVDPVKMSPQKICHRGSSKPRRGPGGRSMSVQSARGPFGSSTTLSSSPSSSNLIIGQTMDNLSVEANSTHSLHSPSRCSSISRNSN